MEVHRADYHLSVLCASKQRLDPAFSEKAP